MNPDLALLLLGLAYAAEWVLRFWHWWRPGARSVFS